MTDLPSLQLWTDGACSGNPGPGGWASLLIAGLPGDSAPPQVLASLVAALEKSPDGKVALSFGEGRQVRAMALSGGEPQTTNNRMEQMGLLMGLQALKRPSLVHVHIDSNYVMQAFTNNWLKNWQRNGWKNSKKQDVPNRDIWEQLLVAVAPHRINWVKVKGHAGISLNEYVDRLAVHACRAHGGRQQV